MYLRFAGPRFGEPRAEPPLARRMVACHNRRFIGVVLQSSMPTSLRTSVWKSAPVHEPILWRHISWEPESADRETKEQSRWGWGHATTHPEHGPTTENSEWLPQFTGQSLGRPQPPRAIRPTGRPARRRTSTSAEERAAGHRQDHSNPAGISAGSTGPRGSGHGWKDGQQRRDGVHHRSHTHR